MLSARRPGQTQQAIAKGPEIGYARTVQTVKYIEIDEGMGLAVRECRPMEFGVRTGEQAGNPCVCVVREADWGTLAPLCPAVDDRGTKHKAKGLNAYMLGRDRVPVIRADYEHAGRCLQSIEVLLKSAAEKPGTQLYVVVVATGIFDELLKRAQDAAAGTLHRKAIPPDISSDPNELILRHLGRVPPDHPSRRKLIGASAKLELVRTMVDRASHCDMPVLLLGDSGTGKEVTARLIHDCGDRAKSGRFLAVNCAAIPDELLESELFGSVSGAFTGATNKKGLWEMAQDGTLFLDEIGDLSLRHQAKVLRVLEEGVARRVGGDKDIQVNARIIAATHRDIEGNVRTDKFRQDLYYRLYGIRILLPSLDECPGDIALLAAHFWKGIVGKPAARLSHAVCTMLESMSWPGNGRQLKALLKRIRQLFDTDEPCVEHFRLLALHEGNGIQAGAHLPAAPGVSMQMECLAHLRRTATALHSVELVLRKRDRHAARSAPPADLSGMQWANLRMSVEEIRALCREPLLFGSEPLFREIEAIVESLDAINGMTGSSLDPDDSHSGTANDLLERIQSAMHDVFSGTQVLISDLKH